jgi:DNA-binding transcriptional ArsR family regulator
VLRRAGVVVAEKRGVWMHYRLNPTALEHLRRYLA